MSTPDLQLTTLVEDLDSVLVMFKAVVKPGKVKASTACAAKLVLSSPRMSLLGEVLKNHDVGMEYMAGLSDLMQRSANDEMADDRFNGALNAFKDLRPRDHFELNGFHCRTCPYEYCVVCFTCACRSTRLSDCCCRFGPYVTFEQATFIEDESGMGAQSSIVALAK